MSKNVDLVMLFELFELEGQVKVGEVTVNDDGSFTGKMNKNTFYGTPEIVTESKQPCVFALLILQEPLKF